jgi:hypothetical protein
MQLIKSVIAWRRIGRVQEIFTASSGRKDTDEQPSLLTFMCPEPIDPDLITKSSE